LSDSDDSRDHCLVECTVPTVFPVGTQTQASSVTMRLTLRYFFAFIKLIMTMKNNSVTSVCLLEPFFTVAASSANNAEFQHSCNFAFRISKSISHTAMNSQRCAIYDLHSRGIHCQTCCRHRTAGIVSQDHQHCRWLRHVVCVCVYQSQ
jgi:hypothetical protein